jgi:hypothetical protein
MQRTIHGIIAVEGDSCIAYHAATSRHHEIIDVGAKHLRNVCTNAMAYMQMLRPYDPHRHITALPMPIVVGEHEVRPYRLPALMALIMMANVATHHNGIDAPATPLRFAAICIVILSLRRSTARPNRSIAASTEAPHARTEASQPRTEAPHARTEAEHGKTPKEYGHTLKEHGHTAKEHGKTLKEYGHTLKEDGKTEAARSGAKPNRRG